MYYDLIIVTQSRPDLITMTQACIDSAISDTKDINVIVVETGQPYKYTGVNKFINYNGEFCYNRALNMGLKYAKGDIHILANNDIIFHKGWSQIGELMQINGYHSASAISSGHKGFTKGDLIYEGYEIGKHLTGWCIFIDKFCLSAIGSLDETVAFWYSDDLYALQIKKVGIIHGLFCNIQVDHITSRTLVKQPSVIQRKYQIGEVYKFNQRKKYYA
jgi:glycosyltransferase involved in cell wall biosynthesis